MFERCQPESNYTVRNCIFSLYIYSSPLAWTLCQNAASVAALGTFKLYTKQKINWKNEIVIILLINQLNARFCEVYERHNLILYDIILVLEVLLFLQHCSKLCGFASKHKFLSMCVFCLILKNYIRRLWTGCCHFSLLIIFFCLYFKNVKHWIIYLFK